MFVKLDDATILDMSTGTCYRYSRRQGGSEMRITFNGPQLDKFCSGAIADGLWRWLNIAAMKFDEVQIALDKALAQ